jgi:hypothetical protein
MDRHYGICYIVFYRNTGKRKTQRGKKNGHIGCDSMGGGEGSRVEGINK